MSEQLVNIEDNSGTYAAQQTQIAPTDIILCQRSTRAANAKPGMLMDGLSGALYEYLKIVPLADRAGRVLFPKGEASLDVKPVCRSNDNVVPSPGVENPPSKTCGNCPMSKWEVNSSTGKKIKPPCSETATLLALARPTNDESDPTFNLAGLPLYLQMRGTSLPFYKDFIKQIDREIEVRRNQGVILARHDFFVTVRGQQLVSPGGFSYVAYTFSELTRVKNVGEFTPFYDKYVTIARQQREAAYEEKKIQRLEGKVDDAVTEVVDAEFVEA